MLGAPTRGGIHSLVAAHAAVALIVVASGAGISEVCTSLEHDDDQNDDHDDEDERADDAGGHSAIVGHRHCLDLLFNDGGSLLSYGLNHGFLAT